MEMAYFVVILWVFLFGEFALLIVGNIAYNRLVNLSHKHTAERERHKFGNRE
jgi:hypothetical protein